MMKVELLSFLFTLEHISSYNSQHLSFNTCISLKNGTRFNILVY